MRSKLYIDFHVIQTVPPSNINRDDTGSPKTAQYGGVRRARVSSQSWKKAMRDYFCDNSEQSNVGCRTLSIVSYIAKKIRELDNSVNEDESLKLANEVLKIAKIQTKDNKTKALFFLGDLQANSLARAALDKITDKEKIKGLFRDNPAIDIALFGRMVADDPSLNEDASSQVAHAISTHAIESEFDFYTAIDDLSPEDNAGAGMLGTVEFNSSTLYRYANVAVHELQRQLDCKEATISTLKLFVEAFVKSLPTGKINSFAPPHRPRHRGIPPAAGLWRECPDHRPNRNTHPQAARTPSGRSPRGRSVRSPICLGLRRRRRATQWGRRWARRRYAP